jgi:hypothetical protein
VTDRGDVRTDTSVDEASAHSIYQRISGLWPQHDAVIDLVLAVGSPLASCLTSEDDGTQVVFGDKGTKQKLEDMSELGPLLQSATLLLAKIRRGSLRNSSGAAKFRILEVGAGTSGTTRHIVSQLRRSDIPFEYVFTDISESLVADARN